MSNYTKTTDFAVKDGLPSGDANKKLRGTEIDAEFEAIETAIATKADASSAALTGTPTAPTAAAATDNTQIATTAHVKDAIDLYFTGMILLWSGSSGSIPTGWAICDGANGTPDLRDRFVVGAGTSYAVGASGGSVNKSTDSQGAHTHGAATGSTALTVDQMPAHTHTSQTQPSGAGASVPYGGGAGYNTVAAATSSTGGGSGHTHTISSDGAHTHTTDVRPPYYALCYIMKL